MADYTSTTKVKAMFRALNTTATNAAVTDAEIGVFIDEAEAEINSKLNKYYTVPILIGASPASNAILSKAATLKVAHLVRGILDSIGHTSKTEKSIDFNKQADGIIKDCIPTFDKRGNWIDAKIDLYDASKKTVGPSNDNLFSASAQTSDSSPPTFQKGVDAW